MGREEGGGFGMGNTCIPVADSFWYLAKLIQLCKFKNKIKLILKKIIKYSIGEDLKNLLDCKEMKAVNPKGNKPWIFIRRTDAEPEAPILWLPNVKSQLTRKKLWCWERLKAGGEGVGWEWDVWIASLIQRAWVWASSGDWWWTGKPGMLQSMGLQRVGHEQQQQWAQPSLHMCEIWLQQSLCPLR